MNSSIKPGQIWLDTNGKPIQAHGFSVFYKDGLYYWYGENKERTKPFHRVWHWGVRCYTSKDLCNWEDRGLIIPPQPEDITSPLHPTYCMDRPHIMYCEKTGKYVAWLKIMAGPISQFMSVMQADSFFGPYEFVHKIFKPLKMDTGDFALCFDEATQKGYIIFGRPHFEVVTATLTDDFTNVTGEYSQHYQNLFVPLSREAPTYFTRNGKKYLFTSGTTGYFPNPTMVAVFEDFHGEYVDLGDPCVGDETNTTFSSQITCVLKIPGKDLWVACADRWKPGRLNAWITPKALKFMYKNVDKPQQKEPDVSPKEPQPLSQRKRMYFENTSKSTYVWLPIEWDGEKPILKWYDEWNLDMF